MRTTFIDVLRSFTSLHDVAHSCADYGTPAFMGAFFSQAAKQRLIKRKRQEFEMFKLMTGVAFAALIAAAPAVAQDKFNQDMKEQYLYQNSEQLKGQQGELQGQGANQGGAIGQVKPNSGPGVQGAPDTRTGPSTKAPDDAAGSSSSGSASTGASTGEAGAGAEAGASGSTENTTEPSQDSSGVQGFPDTRTGPSTKSPSDSDKSESGSQ